MNNMTFCPPIKGVPPPLVLRSSGSIVDDIVDDPPSEDDKSSLSIHGDSKGSPPKSSTFGVHTSEEDSSSQTIHEKAKIPPQNITSALIRVRGCRTRCATKRCPCKEIGSGCSKYCPNRTCVNRQQKAPRAELICLSTEENTVISSSGKV